MSAPNKYDEAYMSWLITMDSSHPMNVSMNRALKSAFLAGWKEGLREAAGIFPKKVCPACGKSHHTATEHCPSCKQAIDAGDKPV